MSGCGIRGYGGLTVYNTYTYTYTYTYIYTYTYTYTTRNTNWLRNWLTWLWLAILKHIGWAGRLETQAGFLRCNLEAEFFLWWKTSVFALEVFSWLDEAHHIMEGNVLGRKPADYVLVTSKKCLYSLSRLVCDQTTGHHSLARLTCTINHHTY